MSLSTLLQPFSLGGLELRNRIVSTAHAPGYADGGLPGERYQRYHEEKARGGVALTMFGGSSIVSPEISPIYRQIDVSTDAVIPSLREFAQRIHRHDTRLMCQISHMGRRTVWDDGDWIVPIAPSSLRDPAHHAVARAMELEDIERVIADYGAAARRCAEGGIDGIEVMVHSHLPGQFLSPEANLRTDEWGGSLANRMRFLTRVLEAIRAETPAGFLVSLRMAVDESSEGGADWADSHTVASTLWEAGAYDLLNLSGIAASTNPGMPLLIGSMARPLGPYLTASKAFRAGLAAPVLHASRIADLDTAAWAVESGATDLVGMTRALMADPYLVEKLRRNEADRVRPCVGAAYCIDRIYAGRDALCAHNPATGREAWLPQVVEPTDGPRRKVVVVGGGPAGLEAARVAARRGHEVVLFEAAPRLGGQVLLAARAAWRHDLQSIIGWLDAEVRVLGVDVRLSTLADRAAIEAERPDVIVLATGGLARSPRITGAELTVSTWQVLEGAISIPRSAFVYDEEGRHAAISVAQHLAERGTQVSLATPDRAIGRDLGGVSAPTYLAALARAGVRLVTDHRLAAVDDHEGGRRIRLHHEFDPDLEMVIDADIAVVELGSTPNDQLFHELRAGSVNHGIIDPHALQTGSPQPWLDVDPAGRYALLPVGDAVSSRDIHAALLDSLRLLVHV
jgi:2,4-dienoyl-CoA reductase-like NADH-dependent reductase (Old Yellow Enzyme family)